MKHTDDIQQLKDNKRREASKKKKQINKNKTKKKEREIIYKSK